MKILMFGKLPPIQGGVSNSTYLSAIDLVRCGHEVHVVTNAERAEPHIRCFSLPGDAEHLSEAGLTIHQIEAVSFSAYTPWATPYTSQLSGKGNELICETGFDLIIGWYLQPYGIAAAVLANFHRIPFILRHAGSDIGRLANYSELRSAFAMISSRAAKIIASKSVMDDFRHLGARESALVQARPRRLPTQFRNSTEGVELRPYVTAFPKWLEQQGSPFTKDFEHQYNYQDNNKQFRLFMYGKVGKRKGSFSILKALSQIPNTDFELIYCIAGLRRDQDAFLSALIESGLREKVWLLPPVMPWHIPKLLNSCNVALYLENRFPISFHSPLVPREILASSAHLVCSGEIVAKSPFRDSLADGKNITIVPDPEDTNALAEMLRLLILNPRNVKDMARHSQFLSDFIESEYLEKAHLCYVVNEVQ